MLQPNLLRVLRAIVEEIISSCDPSKEGQSGKYHGWQFVDLGSGSRSMLADICSESTLGFLEEGGKIIMQDLPAVVKNMTERKKGLEYMVHNIFEAQPVVG